MMTMIMMMMMKMRMVSMTVRMITISPLFRFDLIKQSWWGLRMMIFADHEPYTSMKHELAWVIFKLESIHFLNNLETNLALQLMVFPVPWKIECWYFDSYNWEWNIVVKPTDIGCRELTLKTAAKRSPIYIRLTSNVLCPVFYILGKNRRNLSFMNMRL